MAQSNKLISLHFPYISATVFIKQAKRTFEGLLDTGFDGYVILPPGLVTNGEPPDIVTTCRFANNSTIKAPAFIGSVKVGNRKFNNILLIIMGDEPMIGRSVIENYKVTLDHGRKVTLEV